MMAQVPFFDIFFFKKDPHLNAVEVDPNDSGNFTVNGLSSFNPEEFYYSYVWSRSLCEGRTSFCTELISACFSLCIRLALLSSVPYFFYLYQ